MATAITSKARIRLYNLIKKIKKNGDKLLLLNTNKVFFQTKHIDVYKKYYKTVFINK